MAFVPVQPNLFGQASPPPSNQGGWGAQAPEQYDYGQQGGYQQEPQYDYGNQQQYGNNQGYAPQQQYAGGAEYDGQYAGGQIGAGGGGYRPTSPPMGGQPMSPPYGGYGGASGAGMGGYGTNVGSGGFDQFGAQFGQFGALANPLAQMGIAQASQFVNSVNDSYITRWTGSLRYYFSVNNMYVLHKLKILLFPFIHKSWSRKIVPAADGREMYLPPSQDVNAPDLYLPSMAFITYILLIALIMGTSSSGFKPDLLGMTASSGLLTLALEVLLVKLGFYLLNYPPVQILDLVAYCGYKFVGIIIILLAGWAFGWLGFIASFVVLALFMAIFMVKTLRLVVPQPLEATPRNTRNYALISIAILQGIFTGILCWMDSRNQQAPRPM